MIIGCFHLDLKRKKCEIEKLQLFFDTLAIIYQETDLCIHADFNIHLKNKLFMEFEQHLLLYNMKFLIQKNEYERVRKIKKIQSLIISSLIIG